jgi:hypothetical protein
MSYSPQPGTIPARVIDCLKRLPAGEEMSTGALLDALGQPTSFGLQPCMQAARKAGLVQARKRPGSRLLYWSLGAGDAEPEGRSEPDDDPPLRRVVKAESKKRTAKDPGAFRCAMFSDGTLLLELPAGPVVLDASATGVLVDYLSQRDPR